MARDLRAKPSCFVYSSSHMFYVRFSKKGEKIVLENGRISTVSASAIHSFVIFCLVYQISNITTFVPNQFNGLLRALVLTRVIESRKISSAKVNWLLIDYICLVSLRWTLVSIANTEQHWGSWLGGVLCEKVWKTAAAFTGFHAPIYRQKMTYGRFVAFA